MATADRKQLTALVTGASSGIGAAFAERLAGDGYDVIVVARRRERLEALAQRLRKEQRVEVDVLAADLADPVELRGVEERIKTTANLAMLVNNAGFSGYMPFVELDPDRAEKLIRLQVVAPTRLTRAALPGMIARGGGAIINISSLLAFSASVPAAAPLPKRVTYAATKAYLNAFTTLLHGELQGTGVRMQVLCPGVVDTEFHSQADLARHASGGVRALKPDAVVETSLAGLRLGEVICAPTLDDPALIAHYQESERAVLQSSVRAGAVSKRYTDNVG
jgi:short-subunit dehydrogenase